MSSRLLVEPISEVHRSSPLGGAAPAPVPAPATMPLAALSIHRVAKSFDHGRTVRWWPWRRRAAPPARPVMAVDGVSLEVRRGEIVGILGANGSGKSTLIRLISTLLLPDAGTITVFGLDVMREAMRVRWLINRVSVDAAFFKKLSPMENLIYAARLYNLDAREARRRSLELLDRLGISRKEALAPMEQMSRGMQQKVAIARALLTSPVLLLLDEPTTGLDPRSKRDVQLFVRQLRATHDATVVLTTHDMDEADRLCDRIGVLNRGRLVALDTPAALKARTRAETGAGRQPTLEDVFMHLTGLAVDEATGEVTARISGAAAAPEELQATREVPLEGESAREGDMMTVMTVAAPGQGGAVMTVAAPGQEGAVRWSAPEQGKGS